MNTEPDTNVPDAWIDIAAEGLTTDHIGRRVTVLTPDGLSGRLNAWRPAERRRTRLAGIAHIVNATGDHPVALRTRTLVRIHLETS